MPTYEAWLVESLCGKNEAATYLQVVLEEYQKDGNQEALLLALQHVAIAQGSVDQLKGIFS